MADIERRRGSDSSSEADEKNAWEKFVQPIFAKFVGTALYTFLATNTNVCDIDDDIKKKLRAFRFRKAKTNAAIVLKIDKEKMKIVEDDSFDEDDLEEMDPDTLSSELPAHAPRFVAYSYCYHHDDGRISYPLCLIHSAPPGCNPVIQTMYAGSRNNLVKVGEFTKDMDPDTLGSELPTDEPRFVAYSYRNRHDDGRISYPISLIYSAPLGDDSELQMMYAGCKNELVNVGGFTKVFVVRNPKEIDDEWLKSKLAFFR